MNQTIQVMLVEDHPGYRDVVELALEKEPNIELISQFGTAERALRSLQDQHVRKEPDVVLLDLNLPGMSGLESIHWFKTEIPQAKVIILTQSDNEADILRAISLGACGYLLKSSSLKQITEGILTAMRGEASMNASIAHFIWTTLKTRLPITTIEQTLSEREIEILKLLAEGLFKKEIGSRLGISTSTVVTHVTHIYEKLNVQNAPAAVAKAFRLGIFSPGKES